MELTLVNGKNVEVSQDEIGEFITQVLIPNPYWRHSGLLTQEEAMRYLEGKSALDDLRKVARYILIYEENLTFTACLFNKAEGGDINGPKEFSMPAIKRLRELYQKVSDISRQVPDISQDVHEMENMCLKIGADPL